jgi:hypothetical protein
MSIAIVAASARTGFRVWSFRTIEPDDVLLIISTLCLIGSVVVTHANRDLTYFQMSLSLGFIREPPADLGLQMATFQMLDNIGGVMTWLSIFIVKLSFLAFFKKLIKRVRYLEPFWWIALAFVVAGLCVNVGLGFYICPHFGPDILQVCTVSGMTKREGVLLIVSVVTDIVTDLMVICVPIGLLWRVKIDLRRKIALGTVCSLSVVMIILALIRVILAPIQTPVSPEIPPVTDSTWLFIFQNVEAAVAIVMVSITAFRSMLGQKGQSQKSATVDSDASQLEKTPNRASQPRTSVHTNGAVQQRERNESVWTRPTGPLKGSVSESESNDELVSQSKPQECKTDS